MYPGRFTTGQSSALRKPRVDGKPSLLPKPRRPGSTDRASTEARRPSGQRSSSAEPSRATLAGGRLSREASASKIPLNRRSRSQQAEPRYGQTSMTPLRSSHYSRATTTPVRTPSEDRQGRSWQASVERALAYVTIKDQRPVSNAAWQRAALSRVQGALAARGAPALVRPLSITRFVEVAGGLLAAAMRDVKLNNDNYVAKLPNLSKRLLYPGALSKSWLKTVNTLHAYPHALALIAYFLDLVDHIETPISDEWLYLNKDEVSCLRREYLHKCWISFQNPEPEFELLAEEYAQRLRALFGDDEHKIAVLNDTIAKCEETLADEGEASARAEEGRVRARRDAALGRVRAARAERAAQRARAEAERARGEDQAAAGRTLDADIERTTAEIQELKRELETQSISVSERAQLLDKVDYAARVIDSKHTLAEQVAKMLHSTEAELALWQKRVLDACVQYKQRLIGLAAQHPHLATLAVDEKELMEEHCAAATARAVDELRALAHALAEQRAERTRARTALARDRAQRLEESRAKVSELKSSLERESQALESERAREASAAAAWAQERQRLHARLEQLRASEEQHAAAHQERDHWERHEQQWRTKLDEMQDYIESLKQETARRLDADKVKRADVIKELVRGWHARIDHLEKLERDAESERGRKEREETIEG